ncbi:MAG: IS21 family transposase [Deltaproteobacteria bacterium]|nr:IS21 family transposase [Candidatus Desulfobacula maris]
MLDKQSIFAIHQLMNDGLSNTKIAEKLGLNRATVSKYLKNPQITRKTVRTKSKVDPFKDEIAHLLDINPSVSSVVIRQRLQNKGYDGGISILKEYLKKIRPTITKRAYLRFESTPGEDCQVDWGHFGSLDYNGHRRKLYCLGMIESHSRMLYVEFTHSQRQDTLHRCLLNGFRFWGGTTKKLVHDNMLTAVIEREGRLVRFNDRFLEFLRPLKITPVACNPRQPQEKGKVEKGAIHYIRNNFWPLRTFSNLQDVQRQVNQWLDEVANVRMHSTTGQRPIDRFKPEALRALPFALPDCRDTESVKIYTDFSINFDANRYTVPPGLVGKEATAKADNDTLTIYYKNKKVATHHRCWMRKQRIELDSHKDAARKALRQKQLTDQERLLASLGEEAKVYLENMTATNLPLKKNISKLLELKDEYGAKSIVEAIRKANRHKAYGADYIENILYQEMTPIRQHSLVRLKNDNLNNIKLPEPNLAEYDSYILKKRRRK